MFNHMQGNAFTRRAQVVTVLVALLLLSATCAWAIDSDGDGIDDTVDNCPFHANSNQADDDIDGIGDACDPDHDPDSDGLPTYLDNCPLVSNPFQNDMDMDGSGDLCDNCLYDANVDQADSDNDGIGDVCDSVAAPSMPWGALKASYR